MRRSLTVAAVIAAAGVAGAIATAQTRDADAPPIVLHEDVPPPADPASVAGTDPDRRHFGDDPQAGKNPAAISSNGKILPEPPKADDPDPSEPVHGRNDFGADRDTESVPDYQTGADDTLKYVSVFNPSVLPFKRMSALDTVRDDYVLTIGQTALEDLVVGGQPSRDRDMFWGSLMIELAPGVDVPIPSVAPDMRILSYEVEPAIQGSLTFSKDGADNFYVRSDENNPREPYRLVFLADADATYFAPQVPDGYRVRDVERLAPAGSLRPLPSKVRRSADRALTHLGLSGRTRLDIALDDLVRYFREFEARPAPQPSGDIYWDLFTSQAGVCRHRSFAFMITANALGLPTRYVTNEAHAFVEVWVPESGWLRIDLGGAALRLQVSNADKKSIHRPRTDDPFSKPDTYKENYTRLEGDVNGLSQDQLDEARAPLDPAGDPDGTDPDALDPDALDPDADPDADADTRVGPGQSLPVIPPDALEDKKVTSIVVRDVDAVGFRGESIRVTGRLASGGAGLSGHRVDIYLAPFGRGGDDAFVVGHTTSGADGQFDTEVDLPQDLELLEYEVYAATPGDDEYAPALSE